jgi:uncharacterized protein YprB with RNaseH-like and TPR domain
MRFPPLPDIFRKPPVIKAASPPFIDLSEAFTGKEICNERGRFLVADMGIGDLVNDPGNLNSEYVSAFRDGSLLHDDDSLSSDLRAFLRTHRSRILYLDIETTGLSATPLFLVGTMSLQEDGFRLRQLFAREYCEEAPLLEHLSGFLHDFDCLVTFNGKSFDIPFIRGRASANRVRFDWNRHHLDLLHESRRRYKEELENCRLQTLEAEVCGRRRTGDIPGDLIPDAYHSFVRTGNAYRIRNIMYHNGLDLITMAELLLNILSREE